MEVRCLECGETARQIGHEVYYCDECDKIITLEKEMIV